MTKSIRNSLQEIADDLRVLSSGLYKKNEFRASEEVYHSALELEKLYSEYIHQKADAWRCERLGSSDGLGKWHYYDGPPNPGPLARKVQALAIIEVDNDE